MSTQTVSRVINDRPDVSPQTRANVKKVILDLGYSPNTIARSLSRGRTNTLGVVGFGLEYFGSSSVLTGIERKANELGFSIILTLFEQFEGGDADQVLLQLSAQQVEGIIWAIPGFVHSPDLSRMVKEELTVPIVYLNRDCINSSVVVSMDNHSGGYLATEHLFEQGYQKIGIITGPRTWWEANERLNGWREVMRENNFTDIEDLIFEGNWEAESGDRGFQTLKSKNPDLDAIFVSNDQMSLGVIHAANRMGISIPDKFGIVGFDDLPESSYFIPPLSTVKQDAKKLGALAVTRLVEWIESESDQECDTQEKNLVSPELIIRQSSVREKALISHT